ncbi:Sodium/hydrogen exchanger family-domain-containing protein [Pisolithus orientalis]|uniref:Sodium/hydrogen exchanger family-domain-containing protein n=1 Tax=Pisolithus orientalis TaxID=936130 RepID=UPI0022256F73|nr:Sodium/hydrogen exchanger family-domain-containing protein [Pisolithus orientalis]KAI5996532.1 Sodium/hydrogen exchanger family-domain-containing protein [Pisolithus orientalis]
MPALSEATIKLFRTVSTRATVQGEGGLLTGEDPSAYNSSDPLRLWIIQVGVIIMMAQLLSLGLGRIRQPKVIAEVLGGILLGPTAFGAIPGFTQHIFPQDSLPYLSLVANIGLCLFLFLVGLEIDASIVKRNARLSVVVSLAGIALPFGLGSALSLPLYHRFIDPSVHFTYFMLFTGVAYSITAFPVLCRILTELKLLDTTVGIVVLSAGVGNDIVGWTLLALSVALVNAGSGLTALWTLLICVAFAIFLLWPVKRVMLWLARKTGSVENGPTMFYMTVVILLLWGSAFFTDIVGVNAIFGAFLVGIVVPREGGLAITLTEKLEDMVSIVFLPLYFTLSGLNTNLRLLNNGITWAFTIAIVALSFTGKFGGCTLAAKFSGFGWREASTVGSLMSCKGLVELIVLNVGLEAGILSQTVFSMFVLEALTLTFLTTPLVSVLYPPERRVRASGQLVRRTTAGGEDGAESIDSKSPAEDGPWRYRFTVVLDKLEHIPGAMALTQLIIPVPSSPSGITSVISTSETVDLKKPEVTVDALRLIELSDRTSAVMKSSAADTLIFTDPLLGIFRMFGELNDLAISTSLSVVPFDDFSHRVVDHASRHASQLVLLPWLPPTSNYQNTMEAEATPTTPKSPRFEHNPFEAFFGSLSRADKSASVMNSQFVRGVFAQSKSDVAVFIDTGDRSGAGGSQHVFFPFFGGPDDRLSLEFVVQLCLNPRMTATVVRYIKRDVDAAPLERPEGVYGHEKEQNPTLRALVHRDDTLSIRSTAFPDTVYGQPNTQTRMQSETADSVTWNKYASFNPDSDIPSLLRAALSRIHFSELSTPTPLRAAIQRAAIIKQTHTRLLIVAGRSKRLAVESHHQELKATFEEYGASGEVVRKTIGDVASAMVVSSSASALVVLQAAIPAE